MHWENFAFIAIIDRVDVTKEGQILLDKGDIDLNGWFLDNVKRHTNSRPKIVLDNFILCWMYKRDFLILSVSSVRRNKEKMKRNPSSWTLFEMTKD